MRASTPYVDATPVEKFVEITAPRVDVSLR